MRTIILLGAGLLAACGGQPTPTEEPVEENSAAQSPRDECVAIMMHTRECADVFVPGLLHLRVRLDRPSGIAARFEAEGEEALLPIAREEFDRDWADDRIASNCDELAARPPDEQETILGPERECYAAADCEAFVACDLANKERRWAEEDAAAAEAAP